MAEDKPAPKPDEPTTPIQELWATAKAHSHPEIWGVTLEDPAAHVPSQIIFQKYLNANDGDVVKAKDQLTKTLDWRAKTKPLDLVKQSFSKTKFGGLGYVTKYGSDEAESTDPEAREIFTWNIYGGVKDIDETFGKLEEYALFSPGLVMRHAVYMHLTCEQVHQLACCAHGASPARLVHLDCHQADHCRLRSVQDLPGP